VPEVEFDVRWPDGSRQWVYSPSTVVEDVFAAGAAYPLSEFVALTRQAMGEASRRVQERYGFPCSRVALASVESTAARFPGGEVRVAGFRR
jgi:uncharacterized repeat protein (TIGR04042 family)